MKIGLVVPHVFMHRDILPQVIFAPARQAVGLAEGLQSLGAEVTLFTPGPVDTTVRNLTADLSYFEAELAGRGDSYLDLLKKHPLTFVSLARQVQAEVIAKAYAMAGSGELDLVHIYTNEEDIALPFAALCNRPVVFTHHDPFNFLVKYKNLFPKYKHLNWISLSVAQRRSMPADTNWVANIYHGLDPGRFTPNYQPSGDYVAYLGRIIEPKGVHLAIAAVKRFNEQSGRQLKLKIAGKHYAEHAKDAYWRERILPEIDGPMIEYVGFMQSDTQKQEFLGNAQALIVPSVFEEPFGMVLIEALACGAPVIGLGSGAVPEIIKNDQTGFVVDKVITSNKVDEVATAQALAEAIGKVHTIERRVCRADFEARFTLDHMCREHLTTYQKLVADLD